MRPVRDVGVSTNCVVSVAFSNSRASINGVMSSLTHMGAQARIMARETSIWDQPMAWGTETSRSWVVKRRAEATITKAIN